MQGEIGEKGETGRMGFPGMKVRTYVCEKKRQSMYVCVYVRLVCIVCTCMYVYYIYICMYVCMYVCMCVCV